MNKALESKLLRALFESQVIEHFNSFESAFSSYRDNPIESVRRAFDSLILNNWFNRVQFTDAEKLSVYLEMINVLKERDRVSSDIDFLIVSGSEDHTIEVLQKFRDNKEISTLYVYRKEDLESGYTFYARVVQSKDLINLLIGV